MDLRSLLLEKKSAILDKWFDLILASYPPDTVNFLKDEKDQFSNPVGYTIVDNIGHLFDGIINGKDIKTLLPYIEAIVKIKAVQDFTPSEAISFMPFLKKVIRQEVGGIERQDLFEELLRLESRIDEVTNICFDIYVKCRERIYELRIKEMSNQPFQGIQRVARQRL